MRVTSALAAVIGTAAAVMGLSVTAAASPPTSADVAGYRYWSYYHQAGDGWEYSQVRMDNHVPDDGAVEGWRFVTAELGDDTRVPRIQDVTFEDVCGGVLAANGHKRVALVIDYGRAADAPAGEQPPAPGLECAVVDPDATTAMALSSVAELRRDDERLCGIAGYPSSGCNEAVDPLPDAAARPDDEIGIAIASDPDPADDAGSAGADGQMPADADDGAAAADDGGPGAGLWAGVGVALAVVLGAAVTIRRRRSHDHEH